MKRCISMVLALLLLVSCVFAGTYAVHASAKAGESRVIAIVFDNSGSMYDSGDQAWCRATYAMEVFASMLNAGDTLLIYPMHAIKIGDKTYTMESPYRLTDASKASQIREIYTENAGGTPIESIDCAVEGLKQEKADNKYLIVLTDGGTFSKGGGGLSKEQTKKQLDKRIQEHAGAEMSVMYLGIGGDACVPTTPESQYFVNRQATNTADVLKMLTEMCNLVFGRDTLPHNHLSDNKMDFDISMKKLIVFVQGENIADLSVSGSGLGKQVSSRQTMYSTLGAKDYRSVPDTTLQGMIVTYENCGAGSYDIKYSGTPSSIEVYYEPDADLDFVFTDAAGNNVDPNALYEGEYKVSFGMKDAKTGKLISSDLLGSPKYQGTYSINGQEFPITHEGHSGSKPVSLKMNDAFDAKLTVTYLSGYTITKDSTDFGWPVGGIKVAARPAGEMHLELSGGESSYSLQKLQEGKPFTVKVFYQGTQLTGGELEKVNLQWDEGSSNAKLVPERKDDCFEIKLDYKNPADPQSTESGECSVGITALYAPPGSNETQTKGTLTYNIKDDFSPLRLELFAPEDYIVISEMGASQPIQVGFKLNGARPTPEEFKSIQVQVDCGGMKYTLTPSEIDRTYLIQLQDTPGISEGDYPVKVSATYTDRIGRETEAIDELSITLSNIPLWLKWVIAIGLLILLIILIIMIMRTRVLPAKVRHAAEDCRMSVGGKDVTEDATFDAKLSGKQIIVSAEYNGDDVGRVILRQLTPGKESFLSKPSHRRSILVKFPDAIGYDGDLKSVDVGGTVYNVNKDGEIIPEDEDQGAYTLTDGASVTMSGKIMVNGNNKNFNAEIPLNFKKR